jgi:hypothetical protein
MKARHALLIVALLLAPGLAMKATGASHYRLGQFFHISSEKTKFKKLSGFPHGRPGYVIDYIQPLKRGGEARAYNMQWLPKEEAKLKHKFE